MGQEFVSQWFDRQKGICSSVECYVIQNMAKGYTVNKTTLEAALYGFAASKDLSKLRKQLESVEWRHTRSGISRSGPSTNSKKLWFWAKRVNKYAMLFPFADSAVVSNRGNQKSSHSIFSHKKKILKNEVPIEITLDRTFPQFGCYLCFANGWELSTTLATGAMMKTVGQLERSKKKNKKTTTSCLCINCNKIYFCDDSWGRKLMLTYPWALTFGTFSSEGPTEEQIEASTFTSELFGEGYSEQVLNKYNNDPLQVPNTVGYDLRVHARVHGPDSGYHGTAVMCVESAICLLEEESIIRHGNVEKGFPQIKGGVFTPSTIFSGTTLIDRLNEAGVKFTVQSLPDEEDENEEHVSDRIQEHNMEDGDDSTDWEDAHIFKMSVRNFYSLLFLFLFLFLFFFLDWSDEFHNKKQFEDTNSRFFNRIFSTRCDCEFLAKSIFETRKSLHCRTCAEQYFEKFGYRIDDTTMHFKIINF
ncbi:hypothetical protein RFI_23126 [Reticulomyxa filosa]|uniref:Uncharacterized protein n=1 Tax=Reticulomyxa filosa TaxID=46433 RepID=X6MJQ2_RETFI|nr:hypothetical protein RFI_23126 [Reticulomyxa filosa]|eukprot:ETO14243.1 hypothetical protein RFI_23126 [Reticulomyxa filosa]